MKQMNTKNTSLFILLLLTSNAWTQIRCVEAHEYADTIYLNEQMAVETLFEITDSALHGFYLEFEYDSDYIMQESIQIRMRQNTDTTPMAHVEMDYNDPKLNRYTYSVASSKRRTPLWNSASTFSLSFAFANELKQYLRYLPGAYYPLKVTLWGIDANDNAGDGKHIPTIDKTYIIKLSPLSQEEIAEDNAELDIYPNPATDKIRLVFSENLPMELFSTLKIYSVGMVNMAMEYQMTNDYVDVDISSFLPGHYTAVLLVDPSSNWKTYLTEPIVKTTFLVK